MGYFDGLISTYFKTDEEGRMIFFPYGIFGKGLIISDNLKERELRNFLKKFHIVTFPIVIGIGIGIGWIFSFLILSFLLLWYFISLKRKINGLQLSEERLNLNESLRISAKAHSYITLWILFIFSLLFAMASFFIMFKKPEEIVVGVLGFLFFGFCSGVSLKMLIEKSR